MLFAITSVPSTVLASFAFRQRMTLLITGTLILASGSHTLAEGDSRLIRLRPESSARSVSVKVSFDVKGKIAEPSRPQPSTVPFGVAARVAYGERVLDKAPIASAARHYTNGIAKITVDKATIDTQLRDQHRLLLTSRKEDNNDLYSPAGPLTRNELDLVNLPFPSHAIELLLPDSDVRPGGQWQPAADTMRQMLLLDSVSDCKVNAQLQDIKSAAARVRLVGKVQGTSDGSTTTIAINGVMHVDVRHQLVTWVQMKLAENRGPGHLTHGYTATSDFRMQITSAKEQPSLNSRRIALVAKQAAPSARLVALDFPSAAMELTCRRDWHLISETGEGTVLRLIDNGDLIAQANISRLADTQSDQQLSLKEFQADIQRALAEGFGQWELAEEQTDKQGRHHAKVVVSGQVKGVPIRWIYHHLTDKQGRRAALLFTLEKDLVPRFGEADVELTQSLQLRRRPQAANAKVANRPSTDPS